MGMYSDRDIANFKHWVKNIEDSKYLRKEFKLKLLYKRSGIEDSGYRTICRICGEPIAVMFGDFSKPLDEKFVKCPKGGDRAGHGVWGSAINLILN